MGNMEFPEIPDGDKYATYDDGKQMYGFLKGEVSGLVPYITNCVKDGSDYIITSQLRDKDTDEVIKEIPSEKALEMLAKAWELAGIIVDERR